MREGFKTLVRSMTVAAWKRFALGMKRIAFGMFYKLEAFSEVRRSSSGFLPLPKPRTCESGSHRPARNSCVSTRD